MRRLAQELRALLAAHDLEFVVDRYRYDLGH